MRIRRVSKELAHFNPDFAGAYFICDRIGIHYVWRNGRVHNGTGCSFRRGFFRTRIEALKAMEKYKRARKSKPDGSTAWQRKENATK